MGGRPATSSSTDHFAESVAIVGVGLIGGSIAAALRRRGFAGRVIGVGRNRRRLDEAVEQGLIDSGCDGVESEAAAADLWVCCTPVELILECVRAAARHAQAGTLLTDAGSVKGTICRELSSGLPESVTFIGSHPLAGSEKHGFEHADPDLFAGRVCVITPYGDTPTEQLDRLQSFWQFLGMRTVEMPADEHDAALARTSHLPHVAAAALCQAVAPSLHNVAGTGLRDTTRIAAGSPDLWVGILLENRERLLDAIDDLNGRLGAYRQAIADEDAQRLHVLLQEAKRNRDALGS